MFTRRRFLAAAGGAALSPQLSSAQPITPPALQTRRIPASGEALPVIGAGTADSFEVAPGSPQYEQLRRVLRSFFDAGASVIDTSPNYRGADAVLGQLLEEGGWRKQTFLATKIAANSAQEAQDQWAQTLRKLRTDKVDLLQVHNLRDWQRQLAYARELKSQGKTRYVGVTHYHHTGLGELQQILRTEKLDFIQINYSVNDTGAGRDVLPMARDKGVAVLINRAFDDGRLFARVKALPLPGWAGEMGIGSWSQLFLKFALSHPAVTTVIPATGRPERQLDQLKAGVGPMLSTDQQVALIKQFS